MRFEVNGKTYVIEFDRKHKPLRSHNPSVTGDSTFPYTTVKIVEVDPANPAHRYLFREATVGCYFREKKGFRLEQGRLYALRSVGRAPGMTPEFRKAMWEAYQKREEIKKKPKVS